MGETVRYALFGGLNTGLCFIMYSAGILLGLNYVLANGIAWTIGVLTAFFFNTTFVFRRRYDHRRLLVFVCCNLLSLVVSTGGLTVLIRCFWIDPVLASVVTIPLVILANYLLSKFIVFN